MHHLAQLEELLASFDGLDRQARLELLAEYAASLAPVPAQLRADDPRWQSVRECLTPTQVLVEAVADSARIWVNAPEHAAVVRAVAAVVIEGCRGAPREALLQLPPDLASRIVGLELLGRRRVGLAALVSCIKDAVHRLDDDGEARA